MRKLILASVLAVLLLGLTLSPVSAAPFVIQDNYIGADPTHNWAHNDVIGEDHLYNIDSMEVTLAGGLLNVNVIGEYFDNVGSDSTDMGDLFISVDGWNPYGDAPYRQDQAQNGEDWEFVLAMDSHDNSTTSGDLFLYSVDPVGIELSGLNGLNPNRWVYRAGQEHQYAPGTTQLALAQGNWSISDDQSYLSYSIFYNDWGFSSDEIGFHWTMSCGNDVLEGAVPVPTPEPATILLFGFGLIGLTAFIRRKKTL